MKTLLMGLTLAMTFVLAGVPPAAAINECHGDVDWMCFVCDRYNEFGECTHWKYCDSYTVVMGEVNCHAAYEQNNGGT